MDDNRPDDRLTEHWTDYPGAEYILSGESDTEEDEYAIYKIKMHRMMYVDASEAGNPNIGTCLRFYWHYLDRHRDWELYTGALENE